MVKQELGGIEQRPEDVLGRGLAGGAFGVERLRGGLEFVSRGETGESQEIKLSRDFGVSYSFTPSSPRCEI
jgi:hypothetical protein